MVHFYMLPAEEGDFLWLRYGESDTEMHNIIIDGGTKECAGFFAETLNHIMDDLQEPIDAIFVTHIDNDHIAGLFSGLSRITAEKIKDHIGKIYFNTGRGIRRVLFSAEAEVQNESPAETESPVNTECPEDSLNPVNTESPTETESPVNTECPEDSLNPEELEYAEDSILIEESIIDEKSGDVMYGVKEGVHLMNFLKKKGITGKLEEYLAMGTTLEIGGAVLRVISPGTKNLQALLENWESWEDKHPKDVAYAAGEKPELWKSDLDLLMKEKLKKDHSVNNCSSIAFIFSYEPDDVKLALLGDASAQVCVEGLKCFGIMDPVEVDFLKVSHHGSLNNTSDELLKAFPTENYLLSTNGMPQGHAYAVPNKITMAHILNQRQKDTVRLFTHCDLWEGVFDDEYFTDADREKYLDTEILIPVILSEEGYPLKEGLTLYGMYEL